jgi:hypothetical protein
VDAFDRVRTLAAGYGPAEAFEEYGAVRRHEDDRLQGSGGSESALRGSG